MPGVSPLKDEWGNLLVLNGKFQHCAVAPGQLLAARQLVSLTQAIPF